MKANFTPFIWQKLLVCWSLLLANALVGTYSARAQALTTGACSFWVRPDGTLWGWGRSVDGGLGLGAALIVQTRSVWVGTASTWQAAADGNYSTLALRQDGTLWGWGRNKYGILGDGTTTSHAVPTQMGTELMPTQVSTATWQQVAIGDNASLTIRINGFLWGWECGCHTWHCLRQLFRNCFTANPSCSDSCRH